MGSIVAVTVAAEVDDFFRFTDPRQLMVCLALVPSECPGDSSVRRGDIGMRALVESCGRAER